MIFSLFYQTSALLKNVLKNVKKLQIALHLHIGNTVRIVIERTILVPVLLTGCHQVASLTVATQIVFLPQRQLLFLHLQLKVIHCATYLAQKIVEKRTYMV